MIREGFKIMDFYYLFFIISFYVDFFFFFFKEGEIKRGEIAVMSGKKNIYPPGRGRECGERSRCGNTSGPPPGNPS